MSCKRLAQLWVPRSSNEPCCASKHNNDPQHSDLRTARRTQARFILSFSLVLGIRRCYPFSVGIFFVWISSLNLNVVKTNVRDEPENAQPHESAFSYQLTSCHGHTHTNETCCRTLNLPTKTGANWGWRQKGNTPFFFSFPSSCQLQVRNAQQMRKNPVQCNAKMMWHAQYKMPQANQPLMIYLQFIPSYMFMLSSPCFTEILKHSFTEG